MDFEERAAQKKRHRIRVIIAETLMFISIILIVVVTTLLTMGFFVGDGGKLEQSGLVQIHSLPTGASVTIDGDTIFSRTNLSRTLSAGKHTIKLSKSGYDTWEKDIRMSSGLLFRLYYPRLFLENRTAETALSLNQELEFYTASGNRNFALYATPDSPKWQLIDLSGDEIRSTTLDFTKILPGVVNGQFLGTVSNFTWSRHSDHILAKISYQDQTSWLLLNLKTPADSLNLTKTFGFAFDQVVMINNSANQLYVLEGPRLRRIDTGNQSLSRVLLDNVESFSSLGSQILYVTTPQSASSKTVSANTADLTNATEPTDSIKAINLYRDGEKGSTTLRTVPASTPVHVGLSEYYDDYYLSLLVGDQFTILHGNLPSYRPEGADLSMLETFLDYEFEATPTTLTISPERQFIVLTSGQSFTVVDLELGDLHHYTTATTSVDWLATGLLYSIADDALKVWDFDGTNLRVLVTSTALVDAPAIITSNNKWLYYLTSSDAGIALTREQIQ